ncbi:MAG: response regulator, partial [Planctomycetes bacterium]|nr:response regulator [Planctomycetota bacterium]
ALLCPGMLAEDGVELALRIVQDPCLKATRLVRMLPLGKRPDGEEKTAALHSGLLRKPVGRSRLIECLAAGPRPAGAEGRAEERPRAAPRQASPPAQAGAGIRVLLVEDNVVNQKVAMKLLAKFGCHAGVAGNGIEALHALETADYDVVLMDCMMPEMDGYTAARRIRDPDSSVRDHAVPIIAMTANAMVGDREKCLEAGMNDYLAKPIDVVRLQSKVMEWARQPAS